MMTDHNPVTQFKAESVSRIDAKWHALAGGAWLVCTNPNINVMPKLRKGTVLFRDYWEVLCYDDGCQLSVALRANTLVDDRAPKDWNVGDKVE